jgi:hypothetical protein
MMVKTVVIGSATILLALATIVHSGTPFGSDDAGFLPPDAPKGPITKCENGATKAVSRLAASVIKCHISRAKLKIADDPGEENCEATAIGKFEAKTKTTGCTSCVNLTTIGPQTASVIDNVNNSSLYCASGVPFGSDDSGSLPPDAPKGPITKCEDRIAMAASQLAAKITRCHVSRATGKIPDDAGEESCEGTAITKFTSKTKTVGCDPCTNLPLVGAVTEGLIDGLDSLTYCASPSGAFLDGPVNF